MRVDLFIQHLRLDKQFRSVRRSAEQVPTASDGCDLRLPRVTAVSQTPGTRRIRKDTTPRRFGTLRPRVQIPGPRPYFEFSSVKHAFTDGAGGHNRVTDVSQI